MATKLPYLMVYGSIDKMLNRILEAKTPPRFTQDFLSTKLGFKGGNYMALIPLLKKMGFLATDGTPTDRYKQFRNQEQSGAAIAAGLRQAYSELYARNEYVHDLSDKQLKGLVVETTGAMPDSSTTKATVRTFLALKERADFDAAGDAAISANEKQDDLEGRNSVSLEEMQRVQPPPPPSESDVGLRLSYTINLNLPETTNVEVFDAIFKSLKANLLQR